MNNLFLLKTVWLLDLDIKRFTYFEFRICLSIWPYVNPSKNTFKITKYPNWKFPVTSTITIGVH